MKLILIAGLLAASAVAAPGPPPTRWHRITLQWDPNPEPGVYYVVLSGTHADQLTTRVNVGTSTTVSVNGLRPDYHKVFAVIAVDPTSGLESLPSNTVRFVPPTIPPPPVIHPDR